MRNEIKMLRRALGAVREAVYVAKLTLQDVLPKKKEDER